MNALGLVKNFIPSGAIAKRRIVAMAAAEGVVAQANSDERLLGVSGIRGASATDTRVDVYLSEIQDVEYGELIAFGDFLTAGADDRAVKAEPGAGVTMHVIGRAMESGPENSIGKVLIQPQQITG